MQRMGHVARARLAAAAMAAAGAAALAAAGTPAQATDYDYNFVYNDTGLSCGSFGLSVICGESALIPTPVQAQVGDHFKINVTSADGPIVVPGSQTESLLYVSAFDAQATNGPGAPGPSLTTYQMTPQGFSSPGQPAPIVGPFQQSRTNDYIGFVGYCCGFGLPDPGFSLTGVQADLQVDAVDPRATVGVSVGYIYNLSQLPSSFHDIPGGTEDSPVLLPVGYISQITGSISGDGPEDQFYNFNWQGGLFQVDAKILGADPNSIFTFELRSANGQFLRNISLSSLNNFQLNFGQSLAAGSYIIGLKGTAGLDPDFSLDFMTPVSSTQGIPEPATWALLLAGFGGVGAALRRSRRRVAQAA